MLNNQTTFCPASGRFIAGPACTASHPTAQGLSNVMTTNTDNDWTTEGVMAIEEKVQALTKELELFAKIAPGGQYGELYNYLGTLKVNMSSLVRATNKAMNAIRIKI